MSHNLPVLTAAVFIMPRKMTSEDGFFRLKGARLLILQSNSLALPPFDVCHHLFMKCWTCPHRWVILYAHHEFLLLDLCFWKCSMLGLLGCLFLIMLKANMTVQDRAFQSLISSSSSEGGAIRAAAREAVRHLPVINHLLHLCSLQF